MRLVLCALLGWACGAVADVEIPAVAYHDIVSVRGTDPYAITVAQFEQQLAYLKRKGYQPISLKTLDAARRGPQRLPPKPILLTFDDALRSFDTHARARLERYGYPAIVSIVTRWADAGRITVDSHSGAPMSWAELRTLARSPLIEFASHGDDLHRGVPADAQGTLIAAGTARVFSKRGLEDEAARQRRVTADLARSVARLETELGVTPRAIAWPYGEYDATLVTAATAAGMTYHFTLDDAPTTRATLPQINRFTLYNYQGLADFARALAFHGHYRRDQRFVELDFAMFAGAAPAEVDAILSRALERLRLLRVNAVVLHPFNADGSRSFFTTTAMPTENDLALRVTMALLRRTGVQRIYLRLPPADSADIVALSRDFARRHTLHGVIVDRDTDAATRARLRDAIAHYRPVAQVFAADGDMGDAPDGNWIEVDATESPDVLRKLAGRFNPASTLYIVRGESSDPSSLSRAMTALRQGGARHYGYAPDAMLANRPDARLVIAPLHGHTITGRTP